jgi:hypothetical protein
VGGSELEAQLIRQLETSQDKLKILKDARAKELKDSSKKIEEEKMKSSKLLNRIVELERKIEEDRNYFNTKMQKFGSIDAKTPEN